MRKVVFICFSLYLVGCVTIQKAFVDDIVLPNGAKGVSVDYAEYGWSGCFYEAGQRCTKGYVIHERTISDDVDSKIPVEKMDRNDQIKHIVAVPIRPQRTEKYMIISCK